MSFIEPRPEFFQLPILGKSIRCKHEFRFAQITDIHHVPPRQHIDRRDHLICVLIKSKSWTLKGSISHWISHRISDLRKLRPPSICCGVIRAGRWRGKSHKLESSVNHLRTSFQNILGLKMPAELNQAMRDDCLGKTRIGSDGSITYNFIGL